MRQLLLKWQDVAHANKRQAMQQEHATTACKQSMQQEHVPQATPPTCDGQDLVMLRERAPILHPSAYVSIRQHTSA